MRLPTISPARYAQVTLVALVALAFIVLTGAAVRLTGSGLGCPDWPKCYGRVVAPLETHAIVEYGNRLLSGLVGLVAAAAGFLAWRRRPRRRDLMILGALLPLGVLGQAVLGGFTVRNHLAPGFVMAHYLLSMVILDATVALAWRAHHERGERPRSTDRLAVWGTRALLPLGSITIVAGTAATAAGPHAGGAGTGDEINRLEVMGVDTMGWMITQHGRLAALLGGTAVVLWFLLRRRGAEAQHVRAVGVVCVLLAAQGVVGISQYLLELPAELVWVHVSLAVATWLAILWSVAAAGFLVPRAQAAPAAPERELAATASR